MRLIFSIELLAKLLEVLFVGRWFSLCGFGHFDGVLLLSESASDNCHGKLASVNMTIIVEVNNRPLLVSFLDAVFVALWFFSKIFANWSIVLCNVFLPLKMFPDGLVAFFNPSFLSSGDGNKSSNDKSHLF